MPSMAEASQIRDVAKRHAYVFDNGLCSPDFFDVEKRMASEEFGLLRERIDLSRPVLEIGCFTGLNLIGLAELGCKRLAGLDFVQGAIAWLHDEAVRRGHMIMGAWSKFPSEGRNPLPNAASQIICFDVLEHQLSVGEFLDAIDGALAFKDASVYFLVPVGREFYDCGHVAFFPDAECLHNVLSYFFEVEEIFELKTCRKLFASCKRRT